MIVVDWPRLDFGNTSFAARFRNLEVKSEKKKRTRRGRGCSHHKSQEVVAEVHSPILRVGLPVGVPSCRRQWTLRNCSFFGILESVVDEAPAQHFSGRASLNSQGLRRIRDQDYRPQTEVLGDPGGLVEGREAGHDEMPEVVVKVAEVAGAAKHWHVDVR